MREKFRDAVRDHCLITGEYRGAAHNACNLKLRIYPKSVVIPVIAHNLKNYDAHHIMREIGKVKGGLKCIPNNMEKYVTFSLGKLRFIDSFQHLSTELEKLVASNSKDSFKITKSYLQNEERENLLLRKGTYPYEYMDSFERFNETSLPPKEAFYSTLKMEKVKDEDYEHANKVWERFGMETMGQYHDVYLLLKTLLLADVFESYRITAFKKYGLDPAHYFTTPGYAWDVLLKMTRKELELFIDYDMHLFIEKGMRGGISTVGEKRHAKANNPYMVGYDKTQKTSYIMYLAENNEYGWAMMQYLPTGNFRWLKRMPTEKEIMSWGERRRTGAILEVDL